MYLKHLSLIKFPRFSDFKIIIGLERLIESIIKLDSCAKTSELCDINFCVIPILMTLLLKYFL